MPVSRTADVNIPPGPGFGVYVHWPFCESKCPYCDFNSHVAERVDHARWRAAYEREIEWAVATLGEAGPLPTLTSIFFGGGTPSLAEPETIGAVIADLKRRFPATGDPEITLEANPSSVEAERFAGYRDAGVNRVSLGVQSLDDDALGFLGRRHDRASALAAIDTAAHVFNRYSFDLICARPGQTTGAWAAELDEALSLAGEHLSVYQLTIESGTPFARDGVEAADEDTGAAVYGMTQERLVAAGLPAYEISNHARPGAQCRHNLTTWRGGGYLGIGPGAHGRIRYGAEWRAEHRIHGPNRWLDAVERRGHGTAKTFDLPTHERAQEIIMTSLRLTDGLRLSDLQASCGLAIDGAINGGGLRRLVSGGLVEKVDNGIRATNTGRLRLNGVLAVLLGG